jgi:small subunit ribosomal protein S19
MARKEFSYRGRTLEELQTMGIDELSLLFNSDARRKIKRGFTPEEKNLLRKLAKRDRVKTQSRDMLVLPTMVGKTILVHTGKEYLPVLIQAEMIGNRLGCYSLTRKPVKHTAVGMGSSDKAGAKKDDKK